MKSIYPTPQETQSILARIASERSNLQTNRKEKLNPDQVWEKSRQFDERVANQRNIEDTRRLEAPFKKQAEIDASNKYSEQLTSRAAAKYGYNQDMTPISGQSNYVQVIPAQNPTSVELQRKAREAFQPAKPAQTNQIQGSFDRMMNIGQVGGLGGRMGSLEQASMRLAEAASQRRMGETEKEYGLKGGLLEKQASAEAAGIGTQAKASERASLEAERRRLQSIGSLSRSDRERLDQINRQLGMLG
jgi:hypothetical protein